MTRRCFRQMEHIGVHCDTDSWSHHFENVTVATMTWLTVMKYLCHNEHRYVPFVGSTSWSFPYSWLIIGFATRLTRRLPLVELDLQVFLEHLNSPKSLMGFELLELLLHMYVLSIVVFLNVIVLSSKLVRSFSMEINSCWIKISFSSNPNIGRWNC
jgi:hypothetical protein